MKTIIIYGLPKGEHERYREEILSVRCRTKSDVEAIKKAASADGWHSFRIATWNGEAPDFAAAVSDMTKKNK